MALSAVTVAIVTRTDGPAQTHIPVDSESGLTGYDVSHVSATDLLSVDELRPAAARKAPPKRAGETGISQLRLSRALIRLQRRPASAGMLTGQPATFRDGQLWQASLEA